MYYCFFSYVLLSWSIELDAQVCEVPDNCLGDNFLEDLSVLLQRGVVHSAQEAVRDSSSQVAVESEVGDIKGLHKTNATDKVQDFVTKPEYMTIPMNTMYDLYAGVALVLLSLVLLLLMCTLMDGSTSLGASISVKSDSGREALLDNAKFLLVSMVIFSHTTLIEDKNFGLSRQFLSTPWQRLLWFTVSPLHVRTLCFISGIVSRNAINVERMVVGLIAPLIGYCFIIAPAVSLMERLCFKAEYGVNPIRSLFRPCWLQWFLVGLIWWRGLGSAIRRFSPQVRIALACVLAAMVAYTKTCFLYLPAIGFFPAFVAGQIFPYEEALSKLQWHPLTAVLGSLLIFAIAAVRAFFGASYDSVLYFDNFPNQSEVRNPLHFSSGIADPLEMPFFWLRGLAFTALELLKSIIFLFAICPRRMTFITHAGQHSMYPYLLQFFVLPWLGRAAILMPWLKDRDSMMFPLNCGIVFVDMLICVSICGMLASRPIRVFFWLVIEPTWIKSLYTITDDADTNTCSNAVSDRTK